MLELLNSICIIATILVILFETEFIASYAMLTKWTRKIFKIDRYCQMAAANPNITYFKFLSIANYGTGIGSFFISLITCQICLGVWMSAISCLFVGNFGTVFVGSQFIYFLFCWAKNVSK